MHNDTKPPATETTLQSNQRIQSLDALRGVAVSGVFAVHLLHSPAFAEWLYPELRTVFVFGMFGVDLFYVLSGFFITQAILSVTTWQASAFLLARVRRIYPAYLACLVIMALPSFMPAAGISSTALAGLALHVVMAQNLIPGVPALFNPVFWTLGVEFPYYLVMMALAPLFRSAQHFLPTVAAMILLALVFKAGVFVFVPVESMSGLARFFASTQVLGALDTFALGGLASYVARKLMKQSRLRDLSWRWAFLFAGTAGLVLCVTSVMSHFKDFWSDAFIVIFWRALLASTFAAFIISCAGLKDNRWLRWTGLPWLGKISFSFYLWHYPIFMSLEKLQIASSPWIKLSYLVSTSLILSWLSWRFIETRFHHPGVK